MARDVEIERRLQSWARWKAGVSMGGLGYSGVNLLGAMGDSQRHRESKIPVLDAEAADTDGLVLELPSELRRTAEVIYLQGGTMERKAAQLVCRLSTLYARLDQVHVLLRRRIADRHRAREAEAARVQALQRKGRGV
jgi:hypothetical protein